MTTTTIDPAAEHRAGRVWPAIIVGLLVCSILGQAAIAVASRSSPGLAIQRAGDPAPPPPQERRP
jgi:hypothetical protein